MPTPDYIAVCALNELDNPGSKGVTLGCGSRLFDLFVVRQGDEVRAYRNSCPHTGGPLDWVPDRFLSINNRHIQCATHDALFRWQDGTCVAGPCRGDSLQPVPARLVDGQVELDRAVLCEDHDAGRR